MEAPRYKRKTLLIKRAFQLKFVGVFVGLLFAGAAVSGIMLYLLATREIKVSLASAHLAMRSTWDILLPAVIVTHITTVVLIAIATVFFVMYYTNRVAGPLYRLEQTAKTIGDGDLTVQVRFRERDEISDFREAFQSMVDSLALRIEAFNGPAGDMKEFSETVRTVIATSSLDDAGKKKLLHSLDTISTGLERATEGFKLPPRLFMKE